MRLSIIVAASERGVIGDSGKIPWRIPADFKFFKERTMGHTLIMGRKTFESIGKPLPGRVTIVLTRNELYASPHVEHITLAESLVKALEEAVGTNHSSETFICGGADVYSKALAIVDRIYLTRVHGEVAGDTVVPELAGGVPEDFVEVLQRKLPTEGATHSATLHIYDRRLA